MLSYGVHQSIVDWTRTFLTNRVFCVRVEQHLSAPRPAWSGVLQGSVLGPILFLIFINDLPRVLSGNVLLFADDVKLFAPRSAYEETQRNLRAAFQWSEDADLPLNAAKCVHLLIGRAPSAQSTLSDGTTIPIAESSKDLGIIVSSSSKTSHHYREAVKRAREALFKI